MENLQNFFVVVLHFNQTQFLSLIFVDEFRELLAVLNLV